MPGLALFAKTHEHENVAKQETEAPSRQKWPKHLLASINQHENRLMMNCFLFIIFFSYNNDTGSTKNTCWALIN